MNNTRAALLAVIEKHRKAEASITVSALAKSVEISRSSIYKYYPDIPDLIANNKGKSQSSAQTENIKKIDLMRSQLIKNKELLSYLTNICTNQLIEISILKDALEDLESNTNAKISYLESKVSKLEKPQLRAI